MTIEQLDDIAAAFLGWQCRLREYAVRRGDGRPSPGMCPELEFADGRSAGTIVTLLVKADPTAAIAQFRHIVKHTHDPLLRYEAAIATLQTVYYQHPRTFAPTPTALFGTGSPTVAALRAEPACVLRFRQAGQRYTLPCRARALSPDDPFHDATYWHNAMFNPRLAGPVDVVCFHPEWSRAIAETF